VTALDPLAPLDGESLGARLEAAGARLGSPLHLFQRIGSTSDEAHRLAREGAPHGTAVVAEAQTAGRGRRGRAWSSPEGRNLYLSLILRPVALPPPRAPELTFVAAVAGCQALVDHGVDCRIKWPNDLLFQGKKLGGILTELHATGDRIDSVIVGIGLNVNLLASELPEELLATATSARQALGRPVDRAGVLVSLLSALGEAERLHQQEGFEAIREAWRARSATLGQQVRVRTTREVLEGEAVDLDLDGALLVRTARGTERVVAGDVEQLRPA
jgi:BirA family biotin operon repressor/biotin-[acetyl-CoA-carboxylase] ligase